MQSLNNRKNKKSKINSIWLFVFLILIFSNNVTIYAY